MAAYLRTVSNTLRKSGRSLATVAPLPQVASTSTASVPPTGPNGALRPHLRVPVNPNHGLYGFFRIKTDENSHTKLSETGQPEHVAIEPPNPTPLLPSGRAWVTPELRRKSFKDLHTLWYILLRERNLLATQAAERRRIQAYDPDAHVKPLICRKSMARIKAVISERTAAYRHALRLRRVLLRNPELAEPTETTEGDGSNSMLENGEEEYEATGKPS